MVAVNDVNNEVIAVVMAPIEEEEGAAELIGWQLIHRRVNWRVTVEIGWMRTRIWRSQRVLRRMPIAKFIR